LARLECILGLDASRERFVQQIAIRAFANDRDGSALGAVR
jgi:hypothetical protein